MVGPELPIQIVKELEPLFSLRDRTLTITVGFEVLGRCQSQAVDRRLATLEAGSRQSGECPEVGAAQDMNCEAG